MKKSTFLLLLILAATFALQVNAQDRKMMEKWVPIITERDATVKFQKLEEFRQLYGDKKSKLIPEMYYHLTEATFQLQKFNQAIEFGQTTLTYPEIEDSKKVFVYNYLANAYFALKTDYAKAMEFAGKTIVGAGQLKNGNNSTQIDNSLIAPAIRLQAKIIFAQKTDAQSLKEASEKALSALQIDKGKESVSLVAALAKQFKDQNLEAEYQNLIEEWYKIIPTADMAKNIGLIFEKKKEDPASQQKALDYFLASYQLQRTAEITYYLGVMIYNGNKENPEEIMKAMNYLAEGVLLNQEKWSVEKCDPLLKHLYFNVYAKEIQNAEEKEKGFEDILTAAKTRLGIETAVTSEIQQ